MILKNTLCFVFIGGTHQIYHLAPVAAAISKRDDAPSVTCICADAEDEAALRGIFIIVAPSLSPKPMC